MHMYIELYKMFKNVKNKSIDVQKILYSYTYIVTYSYTTFCAKQGSS